VTACWRCGTRLSPMWFARWRSAAWRAHWAWNRTCRSTTPDSQEAVTSRPGKFFSGKETTRSAFRVGTGSSSTRGPGSRCWRCCPTPISAPRSPGRPAARRANANSRTRSRPSLKALRVCCALVPEMGQASQLPHLRPVTRLYRTAQSTGVWRAASRSTATL
jgi:hypothetical protein